MDEILGPLTEILEGVLQADRQLMEKTKAKVFSAFITVLQMKEMRGEEQSGVRIVVSCPCRQPGQAWLPPAEPKAAPVGVEFSVSELRSLGKLFLPHLFLLPFRGLDTLPLSTMLHSQLPAWEGNLGMQ